IGTYCTDIYFFDQFYLVRRSITYLTPLKKMISIAQNNGWLNNNPFYGHKLTYKQKERSYLTTDELNLIMNADLSHCNKNKQKSRDLFIFSCFTGIS
ncbi:MAG: hypothetical protein RR455_13055, partial [Bacteroidales bacterium]